MPFIGDQATANAKIIKHVFTAEGSQTAFAVASNAGDELQVFLNGVLLKFTDDYTYTTSTVTLGSGATASDIVEVHVYQSFALVDAVRASGDTMTGELETPTVKLSSNIIKASDGGSTLTLDTSDNLTVAGNLQVGGNIIKASDGGSTITLDTADNVTIAGDLKVGAVKASDGTAGISIADSTGRITVTETNPVVTLGSNATFPAGHVIQTLIDEYHRTSGALTITTTLDDHLGSDLEVRGTFASTSNKLLIWLHIPDFYDPYSNSTCNVGFQYDDDSGFGSPTTLGSTDIVIGKEFWMSGTVTANLHVACHATFAVPVSGSAISIRPTLKTNTNTSNIFNNSAGANQVAFLTVQEIKG